MRVAFLYTLASNVPLFAPYIESFVIASSRGSAGTRSSDDVSISHHVQEQLLTDARTMQTKGDERRVTKQVHQAIQEIIEKDDPTIIICTCSTIADMAENFTATDDEKSKSSIKILRVDRPVANIAVHSYAQIHVLAALESTIKPTMTCSRSVLPRNHNSQCQSFTQLWYPRLGPICKRETSRDMHKPWPRLFLTSTEPSVMPLMMM